LTMCNDTAVIIDLHICGIAAAEFCRRMKDERLNMLNEANKLSDEIAALQADIRSVATHMPHTCTQACPVSG